MGAWLTYGIGSESRDLPGFVVLQSGPRGPRGGNPLWGSGLSAHGVSGRAAVAGARTDSQSVESRRASIARPQRAFFDTVGKLNSERLAKRRRSGNRHPHCGLRNGLPHADQRPELIDLSGETKETLEAYGAEPGKPSFANNCLLARRLVERGVRFVQLYHTDWDHHGNHDTHLGEPLDARCRETDQPAAALVKDLKAARAAGRHAGRMGRRVRPHSDGRTARPGRP